MSYHTDALRAVFCLILVSVTLSARNSAEQALLLAREGRFAEARKALEGVAEPVSPRQRIDFHRLKAAIASGLGENQQAAQEMQAALRLAPGDSSLLVGTAVAERAALHSREALLLARAAGEIAPAKALIGDLESEAGRVTAAIEAYRQAIALEPGREAYRVAAARAMIAHQAFGEALEDLRKAIEIFPRSATLKTLRGIALYATGEPKEAEAEFIEAIADEPSLDAPYSSLTKVLLESSAPPAAEALGALCKWNAVACAALELRVARTTGDRALHTKAMAVLEKAPADDTVRDDMVRACALGAGMQWDGRLTEARQATERCVELDPSPQNRYRLAMLYKRLGEDHLARKELALRNRQLRTMSEETALGLSALQSSGLVERQKIGRRK